MTRRAPRRQLDQYMSESFAARALLQHCPISGVVFEPCVGTGALVGPLREAGCKVYTSDIDTRFGANYVADMTIPHNWGTVIRISESVDWVVTNPPFNQAIDVLKLAYEHARVGVAFLLRLSFTEPCMGKKAKQRGAWLAEHPLRQHITLPRYSFTGNGKKDTLTCAWMVWAKQDAIPNHTGIIVPHRIASVLPTSKVTSERA